MEKLLLLLNSFVQDIYTHPRFYDILLLLDNFVASPALVEKGVSVGNTVRFTSIVDVLVLSITFSLPLSIFCNDPTSWLRNEFAVALFYSC